MKSLEELAWTTGDLPDLLTKVILAEVEEAARARRFGRNLVRINEDLVRTKGRSIIFYRRGILTAQAVSEGAVPVQSTITYTPNTLTVSKYSVAAKITQEAIDGSHLDLIRDTIREAGIALADKEDNVIVSALLGQESTLTTEAVVAVDGGTTTLSHAPLTSLAITTGGNTVTVNYYTGVIVASNTASAFTVSYHFTSRENYVDALTEGTFGYLDIVGTANVIRGKKWEPDFMLIHPNQMKDLLKSSQFVDFSKYGAREPLLRGEIGQISGIRVLVTTNMTSGNALIIASKRAAWLAVKRHVDLKRWDDAIVLLVGLDSTTVTS